MVGGGVPYKRGGHVGTSKIYVGISTTSLGQPHYSSSPPSDDKNNAHDDVGSLWRYGQWDPIVVVVDDNNNLEVNGVILSSVSIVVGIIPIIVVLTMRTTKKTTASSSPASVSSAALSCCRLASCLAGCCVASCRVDASQPRCLCLLSHCSCHLLPSSSGGHNPACPCNTGNTHLWTNVGRRGPRAEGGY
jgi:hypothetical protein